MTGIYCRVSGSGSLCEGEQLEEVALGDEPGFAPAMERISSDWPALVEEWSEVLEQFEGGFTTAEPYQPDKILLAVIKPDPPDIKVPTIYTDTASWAISTAIVFLRVAQDFELSISADVYTTSVDTIARALQALAQIQLADGGWSFSASTSKEGGSDLVFTYSVQQALADIDDYVLLRVEGGDDAAVVETPLLKQLNALIAQWPAIDVEKDKGAVTVADVYDRLTKGSVKFMLDRYLTQATAGTSARNGGLEAQDIEVKGRLRLLNERHDLVAAYYEGYLLDGLIISYADEGRPDVTESLRQLYYRLIGRFGELSAKVQQDAEEMKSQEMTTLRIELTGPRRKQETLKYYDAGLWAQILRSMILFRYYVERINQAEAVIVGRTGSVLSLLLRDRRPEDASDAPGLWDNLGFNLAYTARAVEAVIDAYDYLKRVEAPVAEAAQIGAVAVPQASALEAALVSAMTPIMDELIKKRLGEIPVPASKPAEAAAPERSNASSVSAIMFSQIFEHANQEFLNQPGRRRDYDDFRQEFVDSSPFAEKSFEGTRFSKSDELLFAQEISAFMYLLTSNFLPRILEEAVYNNMTPHKLGAAGKRVSNSAAPLSKRMKDLLATLAEIEAEFLKEGREPPLYADYLRKAFSGSGSGRK